MDSDVGKRIERSDLSRIDNEVERLLAQVHRLSGGSLPDREEPERIDYVLADERRKP